MSDESGRWSRRQFLTRASVAAWLTATHGPGTLGATVGSRDAAVDGSEAGRIRSLRLQTDAPGSEMREFYGGLLQLPIVDEASTSLTVRAGTSTITFASSGAAETGAPFYHFAFNIPENKILAAREWQRERTAVIPPYPHLRDPRLPADITHFANWNAHSVFFWDPAGNLLEYIARHDLGNSAAGGFDSGDILYASEIGLIPDDVPAMATDLRQAFGLSDYGRGSDQFTAVGDELGLLLVMRRERNLGFDEGRPAEVFATEVELRGGSTARYAPRDFPFEVSSG